MRKICCSLLLATFATALPAQNLPNPYFNKLVQFLCPFTGTDTITQPEHWFLYQTTDGRWDGPFDSTRCITVTQTTGFGVYIDLKQLDPALPLFVRATIDTTPGAGQEMEPDRSYNCNVGASLTSLAVPLLTGGGCVQEVCSGAFIGIAIPDSFGQAGAATRYQTALTTATAVNPNICDVNTSACFPTERFDGQYLRDFILKFTFDPAADFAGTRLFLANAEILGVFEAQGYLTEIPANHNLINVGEASGTIWARNFMALYTAPTYPGPQHPSFVEAFPVPNTTVPQDITMTVDEFQSLEIQPFTMFRGALVAGSDSVRHQFSLLNDGGDICFNSAELIFNGGDEFQHVRGTLSMNNPMSCMQFRTGSVLRVKEGASLHYGNDGAGILVVCANSTIVLERNSTLIMDGILQIGECDEQLPPQQLYIDLPPGARLIFTDKAWLTNRFAQQQLMRLNVRMLGGTLDDSQLDAGERELIRRVYPEPAPDLEDNVRFYPNPFSSQLNLDYVAGQPETLHLSWTDVQGRLVLEQDIQAVKGINEFTPDSPVTAGLYLLHLRTTHGSTIRKVIRGAD